MTNENISNLSFSGRETVAVVPRAFEIVLIICLFIFAILAIFGNCTILIVEMRNHCKTSTDWLIMFMAANDISCASINIPFYIVFHMGYWKVLGSDVTCKLHFYVEQTSMFSSVLLLCIVAIDRYFKTCRPHHPFLTPTRAFRVCIIETVCACVLMSPSILIINYNGAGFCSHKDLAGGVISIIFPLAFILAFIFMFIIVSICYIRIAYTIRNKLVTKKKSINMIGSNVVSQITVTSQETRQPWKVLFYNRKRTNKVLPVVYEAQRNLVNLYTGLEDSNGLANNDTNAPRSLRSFNILSGTEQTVDDNLGSGLNLTDCSHRLQQNTSVGSKAYQSKADRNSTRVPESKIHRTTKIMFAVTMVFLLSWIPTWAMFLIRRLVDYQQTIGGQVFGLYARKAYLINTFMNPIFYIWMSSSFKERTRKTLAPIFRPRK